MHLNVAIVIKDTSIDIGTLNEENKVLGINIFSKDMIVSFKSQTYQEMTFEMEGSISDFGVDLFTKDLSNGINVKEDSIILSNRKIFPQSLDEQLRLKVRKRPEDLSNIEYDIHLITVILISFIKFRILLL